MLKSGKHTIVCAETGSGKTITYLAPALQTLLDEEPGGDASTGEFANPFAAPERLTPRLVVLVPTQELVSQVVDVVRTLAPTLADKVQVRWRGCAWPLELAGPLPPRMLDNRPTADTGRRTAVAAFETATCMPCHACSSSTRRAAIRRANNILSWDFNR